MDRVAYSVFRCGFVLQTKKSRPSVQYSPYNFILTYTNTYSHLQTLKICTYGRLWKNWNVKIIGVES